MRSGEAQCSQVRGCELESPPLSTCGVCSEWPALHSSAGNGPGLGASMCPPHRPQWQTGIRQCAGAVACTTHHRELPSGSPYLLLPLPMLCSGALPSLARQTKRGMAGPPNHIFHFQRPSKLVPRGLCVWMAMWLSHRSHPLYVIGSGGVPCRPDPAMPRCTVSSEPRVGVAGLELLLVHKTKPCGSWAASALGPWTWQRGRHALRDLPFTST